MIKPKPLKSPMSDIQKTVDALLAAKKSATPPASAPAAAAVSKVTKVAKIHRIQESLNMPDILTYLEAFTDLPEELIDELMLIVEKSPSALAVKTFAKKWGIV